jgi:hypothetical protein
MSFASSAPDIIPLFATPVVIYDVPDALTLNVELRRVIEQREQSQPSTQHSNLGGWQSSWDMDRWGGAPAVKLLAIARNVANRVTTDRKGAAGSGPHPGYFAVTWHGNMWANVNRTGHANEYHSHPGAFWSGVYYVDDGGIADDPSLGGELEFMDPRGPLPAMNAPPSRLCHGRRPDRRRHGKGSAEAGPHGALPFLGDASGATLSGYGRSHFDRLQSQPVDRVRKVL